MSKINSLILSREVYSLYAVETAAKQFEQITEITINEKGRSFECSFKLLQNIPINLVKAEFENYVIDLINSEKLYDNH